MVRSFRPTDQERIKQTSDAKPPIPMGNWISDLLLFASGFTGGILACMVAPYLRADRERRTDLAATRSRMLTDMKQQHEQEILHAAVRAAEDVRGELHESVLALRKALLATTEFSQASVAAPEDQPAVDPPAQAT